LFNATLLEVLGGEKVIGVDIFIPEDLRQRLMSHSKMSERIVLLEGSSIEQSTMEEIKSIIKGCRETLIFLDSNHTHEHVLQELRMYSPLVGKGYYLICGDTIIADMPIQEHRQRNWDPDNNPKTALQVFLGENNRFEVDRSLEDKLLLSCNPGGFLKCIRD